MKKIIYIKADGHVATGTIPAHIHDINDINLIAERCNVNSLQWFVADEGDIPSDAYFFDAWRCAGINEEVTIDITEAREIHVGRVRNDRDRRWEDFDRRYSATQRDGGDLTILNQERQLLKDGPNTVESAISVMTDLEQIKATIPNYTVGA